MSRVDVLSRAVLERSFSAHGADAALDRYVGFAGTAGWSIPHKVELYEAGLLAADATRSETERRSSFRKIHSSLAGSWQVFRPVGAARCWNSDQIFDHLVASDSPLTRTAGLRASDVYRRSSSLVGPLERLGELKPGKHYPRMAVSKFAHFANPRLVPIYDQAVVRDVALAEFRSEFDVFCRTVRLDSHVRDARFLHAYVAWAGDLVSRDSGLLSAFGAWIRKAGGPLPPSVDRDVETYEAAAFEMILIGAAHLVLDSRR